MTFFHSSSKIIAVDNHNKRISLTMLTTHLLDLPIACYEQIQFFLGNIMNLFILTFLSTYYLTLLFQ